MLYFYHVHSTNCSSTYIWGITTLNRNLNCKWVFISWPEENIQTKWHCTLTKWHRVYRVYNLDNNQLVDAIAKAAVQQQEVFVTYDSIPSFARTVWHSDYRFQEGCFNYPTLQPRLDITFPAYICINYVYDYMSASVGVYRFSLHFRLYKPNYSSWPYFLERSHSVSRWISPWSRDVLRLIALDITWESALRSSPGSPWIIKQ